jgi:hypothetical protein
MLSIYEVSYLYRGRCYYSWRGGSQKILVKLSICLIYRELITLGAGTTTPLGAGTITSLGEGTTTPLGAGTAISLGVGTTTSLGVGTTTPLGAGAATTASGVVARESYLRLVYA